MMPSPADAFADYCVELLAPLGAARARRMFGGHGLYLDGLMVGLIADEQLYLKADGETLGSWQAAGGRPFVYESRRGGVTKSATMSYWTPPAEALDSPQAMAPWARLALQAALRALAARPPRRPAGSRSPRAKASPVSGAKRTRNAR